MGPDDPNLWSVPDGGVLRTLPNGIQILRMRKHEPIETEGMTKEEVASRTDKLSGSKFLPGTSLERIVEITCEVLEGNNALVGSNEGYAKIYGYPIGISRGKLVRGVRVRRSSLGRNAHAFPEDEGRL